MAQSTTWNEPVRAAIAVAAAGLGLGWMIGMSVHPVVEGVITSLLALATTLAAITAGIEVNPAAAAAAAGSGDDGDDGKKRKARLPRVAPLPVAALLVGIAIGSSVGVYARTNAWLGPDLGAFVEKWRGTMIPKPELQRRLFDSLYPEGGERSAAAADAIVSGYFASGSSASRCAEMRSALVAGPDRFEAAVRANATREQLDDVMRSTNAFRATGAFETALGQICPEEGDSR